MKLKNKENYKNKNKFSAMLLIVTCALSLVTFLNARAVVDATLLFDKADIPGATSVNVGDTVTLVARVNPTTNNVGAVALDVTFNPAVLRLESITRSAAFNMTLGGPTIDNIGSTDTDGVGSIDVGLLTNPATYVTINPSDVATYVFTALSAAANSPVSFAVTSNASAAGSSVVSTRTGTQVTIAASGGTPPTLTQVTAVPSPTGDTTPSFTFNSSVVGTITYPNASCKSTVNTTTVVGDNTITFDALASGTYICPIVVTETATPANFNTINTNSFTVDATAPVITATAPSTNAFFNSITASSDVSYALSEAIASGSIVFTQTGGSADGASPHTCTLTGTALNVGAHNNLDLSDTTNSCTVAQSLVDGAVYTVAFDATDAVGNTATQVSNTGVTFDSVAPIIASTAPSTNAFFNSITTSSDVSFDLSEDIANGSIVFTRTGGTADGTVHTCTLTGVALNIGTHSNLDLSNTANCTVAQSLVSGAIYTVAFNASDIAGNSATQVSNTSVTFDSTAPEITATAPATNAFINSIATGSDVSFTLSEDIASGSIVFTRTGGTADGASPHTCTLTGLALNVGAHNNLDLSDTANCTVAQSLVDGAIYTVVFNTADIAGNNATQVSNTGVTFDSTAPVVAQVTAVTSPTSDVTPVYTFSSTEAGTVSYGGDCSGTTGGAVSSGNTTVSFATLAAGTHSNCTVTVTDAATNASNVLAVSSFIIDATAPVVAQVTAVTTPTNSSTPSYTFSSTKAGTITYGGSCSSATTNAVSGNNTITFGVLSNGTYSNCTVRVTDAATNVSNILAVNTFVVDTTAPTIAQVTAVTTPTSDTTPDYVFSSTETGTITYGGSCSSATTNATSGNNTISFNALTEGTYANCTIRVTDAATNASNLITVPSFTINAAPIISAILPTGTLAAGTTQATVTFTTNESGICRYAPASGTAFGSMTNIIDTVLATSHTFSATGLTNGGSFSYWVRCEDSANMVNLTDTLIAFSVASPAPVIVSDDHSSSSKKKETVKPRSVSVSKKSVKFGQVLTQRGKKFSKNSFVLLYFQKAGGGYYAPQKVKTSAAGGFVVTYKVNKPKGKYGWYVFDTKANKKSKTSYYTVK